MKGYWNNKSLNLADQTAIYNYQPHSNLRKIIEQSK